MQGIENRWHIKAFVVAVLACVYLEATEADTSEEDVFLEKLNELLKSHPKDARKLDGRAFEEIREKALDGTDIVSEGNGPGDKQDEKQRDDTGKFWDKLVIQHSVFNRSLFQKAANFNVVAPDDSEDSHNIDIGVAYYNDNFTAFEWGPKFEYHRNTASASEQDTGQVGLTFLHSAFLGIPQGEAFHLNTQFDAEYKNDRVKETEAWQLSLKQYPKWIYAHVDSIGDPRRNSQFKWLVNFNYGLEYEDVFETDSTVDGDVLRGTTHAALYLYPFYKQTGKQIELAAGATKWWDIDESGTVSAGQDSYSLLTGSLNFYLSEKQRYGFGISWIDGDNPAQGKFGQDFVTVGFKYKYVP